MASSPAAGHDTPFSNAFLVLAESTLPDPERVTEVAREKVCSLHQLRVRMG
jgi:hypothetical protein